MEMGTTNTDNETDQPKPLKYARDRAAANVCRGCNGQGMIETESGNFHPCHQPGCDGGFMWVDGSQPTILEPGPGKVPIIAARERVGLPLVHPEDMDRITKHRFRKSDRIKRKEPETVDDILKKWRTDRMHNLCNAYRGPQDTPQRTVLIDEGYPVQQ
ncbi:hypothetical protein Pla110_24350 [Polystyrenella longa]|uniref:Uncharacterized protein n=1 Tax=Polystyrenella longa TaxID=2528007 RepID=A0A518CNB4_9PLAN|nr:hypothetical protein [Polystyrenella longa]QDU80703.1 hypothetical protein Pla110_24350 [Polystyrenella longa]